MSELAKTARKDMRAKIDRMVRTDPRARVDASDYRPPDALDADVQTGPRPVSRRQFKRGGSAVSGLAAAERADRKPRKSGGSALATPDNLQNRDLKEANEERAGTKHIGGFKHGGSPHKDEAQDKKLIRAEMAKHEKGCKCAKCMGGRAERAAGGSNGSDLFKEIASIGRSHANSTSGAKGHFDARMKAANGDTRAEANRKAQAYASKRNAKVDDFGREPIPRMDAGRTLARGGSADGTKLDGEIQGTRPTGGRLARKSGGKTGKGKMNVNIIISTAGKPNPPPMPMMPPGAAPGMPPGLHQGAPPPPMPQGAPGGAGIPPGAMPRRAGGRTNYEAGAGSGLGRLEKIKAYGKKA